MQQHEFNTRNQCTNDQHTTHTKKNLECSAMGNLHAAINYCRTSRVLKKRFGQSSAASPKFPRPKNGCRCARGSFERSAIRMIVGQQHSIKTHTHASIECRCTHRDKTARSVGGSDGHGRAAVERFVVVHGHERQHDDEREDQLDGEALPGAQRRIVRDGRLQIALVAGHGDTARR